MWFATSLLSAVMTGLTVFLAWKNHEKKSWSAFAAVSFTAFSVLLEYKLVDTWVFHKDWGALIDVVPGIYGFYRNYLIFIVTVNGLAMVFRRPGRKERDA